MENKSVDSINKTAQGCPLSSLSDTFRLSNEQLEPLFRRARTEHPVYFLPDIGYWAVSRYEDIRMVLSDKERFSSGGKRHLLLLRGPTGLAIDKAILWATGYSLMTKQYCLAMGEPYAPTLMLRTIGARTLG